MSDYITLDEFKSAAEMTSSSFTDYEAQRAITGASLAIDNHTDRFFYQSSGTQQMLYEWRGERCLSIDDAVTVSTVEVDYDRNGTYETTWASGTDYLLEPFNAAFKGKPYEEIGLLPTTALWRRPVWYPALVRVTGTFGWPAVPEGIEIGTTILANRTLKRMRETVFPIAVIGDVALRILKADPEIQLHVDPYTRGDGVMAA